MSSRPRSVPLERVIGPRDRRLHPHAARGARRHVPSRDDASTRSTAKQGHAQERRDARRRSRGASASACGRALALAERPGSRSTTASWSTRYLQTSAPDIFAAGDIARWPDPHTGERSASSTGWSPSGRARPRRCNMLGLRPALRPVPFFWSQHYDVPINYVGHAETWDEIAIEGDIGEQGLRPALPPQRQDARGRVDLPRRRQPGGRDRDGTGSVSTGRGSAGTSTKSPSGETPWRSNTAAPLEKAPGRAPSRRRASNAPSLDLATRMRRNRKSEWARRMVRENVLTADDLIWPLFVVAGKNVRVPVGLDAGCRAPLGRSGGPRGGARRRAQNPVHRAVSLHGSCPARRKRAAKPSIPRTWSARPIRAIKKEVPDIGILCDVALDPYTSHGHDGLMRGDRDRQRRDGRGAGASRRWSQAEAGCDIIAPSDMMDGRVGAIRAALDEAGLHRRADHGLRGEVRVGLLRPVPRRGRLSQDARPATSAPTRWTRPTRDEALREVALDIAEGADMVMVKPGLPYLDIVAAREGRLRHADLRLSGVRRVFDDHGRGAERLARSRARHAGEPASAFKRAGADGVLTYFAPSAAERLKSHT